MGFAKIIGRPGQQLERLVAEGDRFGRIVLAIGLGQLDQQVEPLVAGDHGKARLQLRGTGLRFTLLLSSETGAQQDDQGQDPELAHGCLLFPTSSAGFRERLVLEDTASSHTVAAPASVWSLLCRMTVLAVMVLSLTFPSPSLGGQGHLDLGHLLRHQVFQPRWTCRRSRWGRTRASSRSLEIGLVR